MPTLNSTGLFLLLSISFTLAGAADPGAPVLAGSDSTLPFRVVDTRREPVAAGPFAPDWDSLSNYEAPDWFRDAKFGIWAHWGPQCEPENGDWYARYLYMNRVPSWGRRVDEFHRKKYGHPSQMGFKDVIRRWKAERWDPAALMALYKRAGAQYFMALANHHDNFDNWDSKYQPWNSVRMGPQKDLIGGWAAAARAEGLRFGMSVHAAHAWTWYEPAQGADESGEFAGVPYDGKLTLADGKGQWWEGLDPQDLYAQNHPLSADSSDPMSVHRQWDWDKGASVPDAAYCEKFYNRTVDLINQYKPDLVYFDDTVLPLWPISDAGLKIAAHYYNSSQQWHGGRNEAVLFGKILSEAQKSALLWDVERGAPNRIEAQPWQTCTCIGQWHYNRSVFEEHGYKSARTVIHTLADVVSKNGNLLLSIPLRGDGTLDDDEIAIVEGIAAWMDVNKECIFGTRPWKIYGEGPSVAKAAPLQAQGFNEGQVFTAEDVRYTTKGGALYAIVLGEPKQPLRLESLGHAAALLDRPIARVEMLGGAEVVVWSQRDDALVIEPAATVPNASAIVYRINVK